MPGIRPLLAISLKQILQRPNFLIYPLFLPHLKHLLTTLDLNLGFFLDLAICALVAIILWEILIILIIASLLL